MINFISKPNLPENAVKTVICGTDDEKILNFFKNNGIKVISSEPNNSIDVSVSMHADMSALHLGNEKIIVDRKQKKLKDMLSQIGMTVYITDKEISGVYPDDIKLNFALIGKTAVGNFKYADSKLTKLIANKEQTNVKQGYCKCSVLVVNEEAVITDDESIHRKMLENSVDSLLINKGDVSLPGHGYGFIGGASGKISKNKIVFFGDIKNHCNFYDINSFLTKHGCEFVCTDDGELRDIGGIIPVQEENL